ncbi:MAG: tRNA (guanosine(37)-N1)-methyltransferase TrmD [bacterium]
MIFHIVTLFPEVIHTYTGCGVLGKAAERGIIEVRTYQLRDYTDDRHRTVDDYPYGGGAGMILKPEPIFRAVEHIKSLLKGDAGRVPVYLTTPQGEPFSAAKAKETALLSDVIIVCGHYGGVDERVAENIADELISVGDFVMTGGELASLIIVDVAARFVPGVVGNEESVLKDSFEENLLGAPQYTRPPEFQGWRVPDVLLSGDHKKIETWRREQQLKRTAEKKPENLKNTKLSGDDTAFLKSIGYDL